MEMPDAPDNARYQKRYLSQADIADIVDSLVQAGLLDVDREALESKLEPQLVRSMDGGYVTLEVSLDSYESSVRTVAHPFTHKISYYDPWRGLEHQELNALASIGATLAEPFEEDDKVLVSGRYPRGCTDLLGVKGLLGRQGISRTER